MAYVSTGGEIDRSYIGKKKRTVSNTGKSSYNPDVVEQDFIDRTFVPSSNDEIWSKLSNDYGNLNELSGGLGLNGDILKFGIIGFMVLAFINLIR